MLLSLIALLILVIPMASGLELMVAPKDVQIPGAVMATAWYVTDTDLANNVEAKDITWSIAKSGSGFREISAPTTVGKYASSATITFTEAGIYDLKVTIKGRSSIVRGITAHYAHPLIQVTCPTNKEITNIVIDYY